jgi:hypothetical protein
VPASTHSSSGDLSYDAKLLMFFVHAPNIFTFQNALEHFLI